jgi:hypothetical protein
MAHKLLTVLILVSSIILIPSCKKFLPGKNTEGTLNFTVGTVTLNGKPAVKGDTVRFGDVIETGDNSTCQVLIAGKNLLGLTPKSRLVYRVTTRESNLELSTGGLGAMLRNRDATGDVIVKMPTVTASIRGTIFFIKAESREKSYACVCNGRIRLTPDGSVKEELVSSRHHTAFYYTREKGAVKVEHAGLKYHSDEVMNKAAAAIGETIDWTTIE